MRATQLGQVQTILFFIFLVHSDHPFWNRTSEPGISWGAIRSFYGCLGKFQVTLRLPRPKCTGSNNLFKHWSNPRRSEWIFTAKNAPNSKYILSLAINSSPCEIILELVPRSQSLWSESRWHRLRESLIQKKKSPLYSSNSKRWWWWWEE